MSRSSIILVLGGLIFILLVNSIFIVNEKEKALVTQFGEVIRPDVPVGLHLKLPIIDKNQAYLLKNDFSVFSKKKSKITMTGHLMFKKLDSQYPVTHSKKIIKIIRNKIRFNELIITDDISMKALNNNIEDNVIKSFSAGCNLVLHCNGKMSEMLKVAKNSPKINNFIIKKTSQITNIIS